jgi:hypothetical protein
VVSTPGDFVNVHPSKLRALTLIAVEVFEDDFMPSLKAGRSAELQVFDNAVKLARSSLAKLFS